MQARHAALPFSCHPGTTTLRTARPPFPEALVVSSQRARAGKHGRQTQRAGAAPCVGSGATTLALRASRTHHPAAVAFFTRQPRPPQVPLVEGGSASVVGSGGSQTGSGRKRPSEAGKRGRGEAFPTIPGGARLEVLAAHQARVHVDRAQRHRAALFKVEVQVLRARARGAVRSRRGVQAGRGAAPAPTGQAPMPASSRQCRTI
jgi:hypothetical protein